MEDSTIEQWVMQYSDMLLRYALPRVNNRETAKDLVQDTFLAAWRNKDRFRGEVSEKNWLFTILKNKIIDHFRKAANRLTDSLPEGSDEPYFRKNGHWNHADYPAQWGVDYSSPIENKEFYEVLNQCKGKLKDIQNAVFTMKYLEGAESEQICKDLHITPSNYWVLLHRAKVQLRACLEKNWFVR